MSEIIASPLAVPIDTMTSLKWDLAGVRSLSDALGDTDTLLNLRLEAFARLKHTPWPTTLDEAWRRNNPGRIERRKYRLFDPSLDKASIAIPSELVPASSMAASRYTFQNCRLTDQTTITPHANSTLRAGSIRQGLQSEIGPKLEKIILEVPDDRESPAISLLHLAYSHGGGYCLVPANWSAPQPVIFHHHFFHPGQAVFPLNVIKVGKNSRISVVLLQDDSTDSEAWLGAINRVILEDGATLNLIMVNKAHAALNFYDHLHATLGRDSQFNLTWFDDTSGWAVMRREAILVGKGSSARIRGANIGNGSSLYDLRTLQDHSAESTNSDLMFKAVNFDQAKSVYQGMIKVHPEAVNANAYQLNRNLLMSPDAKADSIPKLEILVDEVRCTHGASAGKPDPNSVFYLKSRGIPEKDATRLIVEGFLNEAGSDIKDTYLSDYWQGIVSNRLNSVLE